MESLFFSFSCSCSSSYWTFQLLIFLIASLIMQALQRNTRKAEKEREVTRFHTYFNPDCHSCSRISSYMLAVGGGTVFLSAGLSNPCLSATDVGDAGAQFHCCSCIIKYPTTVRGGVPESAARFVVLHAFVRARARTALCYRSAARFPPMRATLTCCLWIMFGFSSEGWDSFSFRHRQGYAWRLVPDGLIEVGESWAAATPKQNEACQHGARPSRRGDKRDGARMILISSGSGNHSLLSRWYLDLWIVFHWKRYMGEFKHARRKLCLWSCE